VRLLTSSRGVYYVRISRLQLVANTSCDTDQCRDAQELKNLFIAVFLRLLQSLAYRYSDKRRLLYFGRVI